LIRCCTEELKARGTTLDCACYFRSPSRPYPSYANPC
jgi:hypothetical protein